MLKERACWLVPLFGDQSCRSSLCAVKAGNELFQQL